MKNRKSFDDALAQILGKALPGKIPVCLMMVDIDHFKSINDRFGHLVGDQVIRMIASVMKVQLGEQTHLARYGGEEFVALRSGSDIQAALRAAEQFRKQIAERPFKLRSTGEMIGNLTISVGVAALRSTDTAQSLVDRADRSLYFAKQNGRNRIASERDLEAAA
jgi:diguanylate cyclase